MDGAARKSHQRDDFSPTWICFRVKPTIQTERRGPYQRVRVMRQVDSRPVRDLPKISCIFQITIVIL